MSGQGQLKSREAYCWLITTMGFVEGCCQLYCSHMTYRTKFEAEDYVVLTVIRHAITIDTIRGYKIQ